jgi:hypothetical protein
VTTAAPVSYIVGLSASRMARREMKTTKNGRPDELQLAFASTAQVHNGS